MTPGSILHDTNFKFTDGEIGNKLLIVLNDGKESPYIIIKTTSKQKLKGINQGCQLNDRPPNFFLPKGSCSFIKDTWVELSEFFEFTLSDMFQKKLAGTIDHKNTLPEQILKDLLNCAVNSDDISEFQENILRKVIQEIN
jgi:hypothetical protein